MKQILLSLEICLIFSLSHAQEGFETSDERYPQVYLLKVMDFEKSYQFLFSTLRLVGVDISSKYL